MSTSHGSQEPYDAVQAQEGGRCQAGQVDQCGLRSASCWVCRHQGVPSRYAIGARSVGLFPRTISCGFSLRKREPTKSHEARTWCCCAYRGDPNEHETGTCIDTMQHGDEDATCTAYQAEYPPQGNCEAGIEGLSVANYVHKEDAGSHKVGSHRRVHEGFRSRTLKEFANFRKTWSKYDRSMEQAVTCRCQGRHCEGGCSTCYWRHPWESV